MKKWLFVIGLIMQVVVGIDKTPEIIVRQIASDEWDQFKKIWLEALENAPLSFASTYTEWAAKSDAAWEKIVTTHSIFCAFAQNHVIGCAALQAYELNQMKHKGNFLWLYVSPAYRKKGIANQLLQSVIVLARAQNITQLLCGITAENSALIKWYKKIGFKEYGFEPQSIKREERVFSGMHLCVLFLDQ